MRQLFALLILCLLPCSLQAAEGQFIPRSLVAVYDSRYELNLRENSIHHLLGLPANRLGYETRFIDINQPLPELGDEVHGILIWSHNPVPQPEPYIDWLVTNLERGKRLVVMENLGVEATTLSDEYRRKVQFINERLGFRDNYGWNELTYNSRIIHRNPEMVDFERKMRPPLPSYADLVATPQGTSHMRISRGDNQPGAYADVVITGPQGGFVAPDYAYHGQEVDSRSVSVWLINPFNFLKASLNPPLFPVPDVTTRNGRRIFYAHIDGDGWNNPTHIEQYRERFASSADVIGREIIEAYPDFAFTVGVVAGEVADDCFGSEKSRNTARYILALPNVEVASHTYTHPLYWQFFENYTVEKERPYAGFYPRKSGLFRQDFSSLFTRAPQHQEDPSAERERTLITDREAEHEKQLRAMYKTPRSFNCTPFDEHNELVRAKEVIESLAPPGKRVSLLQWPGNTSPYEGFLKATREAGMLNINGGESRYDAEYPSYSTLYPIGIRIGDELQIYSSASNENTYTNLWSERFYGYRYLIETVRHTESPIRVAPFNVYFHSYSGERPGSLLALKEIMNFARSQEIIPITTSDYARIANGFYSTRIETLGKGHWRIHDRGHLQTLRIPAPKGGYVDISRSKGVLGQRMLLDNLYIFLNPTIDKPEIFYIEGRSEAKPSSMTLYSSRWDILSAERESPASIKVVAQGYGEGEMTWLVPQDGIYRIEAEQDGTPLASLEVSAEDGRLRFGLGQVPGIHPTRIRISLKPAV